MDDNALAVSKKKLTALDRQYADLTTKQRRVEKQLADEHDLIRKAAAQRVGVVSQLVDAAPEQAAKLHKQLDSLDAQIKGSERMAESLQQLLRTLAGELADLTSQRDRLNAVVAAENTSREFAAWTVAMTGNFKAAHAALSAAREALGKLTVAAAHGSERFAGAASTWSATRFDEFERLEANPDSLLGFKQALPWYRNVIVHVHPMTRG